MSGHSKWSKIKRAKGAADILKGASFTRATREIILAARSGGGNPDANFRLRLALEKAHEVNMPRDNIDRAIKKGTGEAGAGGQIQEITFEGYGPKGVAILVETVTDNRNRTVQEVRSAFTKNGGNMGESGSVGWMFESKGVLQVDVSAKEADDLSLAAIDAGAEDVKAEEGYLEIYTAPKDLEAVKKALEARRPVQSAEVTMIAKNTVAVEGSDAEKVIAFIERLEELDDVQKVHSNADISDATLEKLNAG